MTDVPALVRNRRLDIIAGNRLGHALYSEMFAESTRPNSARFVFLDPRAANFFVNWAVVANEVVAVLRSEAGRDPYDRGLTDLVGELSTRSEAFRARWAAHDVRFHETGVKHFHHPVVGELSLTYENMELPADTGLTVLGYTADPGSASEQALKLLARLARVSARGSGRGTSSSPDGHVVSGTVQSRASGE